MLVLAAVSAAGVVAIAGIGVLAWRRSWTRCRLQIRALPERLHHHDKEHR